MFSDLRTWAWITLIVGMLAIMAAGACSAGSQWARWFGIFAAGLNAIAVVLVSPGLPALDAAIIFACDCS